MTRLTSEQRARGVARLRQLMVKPERRSVEERAPIVVLKSGAWLMIEHGGTGRGGYNVSQDFGCTCRRLAWCKDLEGVLDVALTLEEIA